MIQKPDDDRWPITAEDRRRAVETILKIIESGEPKHQLQACRLLAVLESQNQKDQLGAKDDDEENRVLQILEKLRTGDAPPN